MATLQLLTRRIKYDLIKQREISKGKEVKKNETYSIVALFFITFIQIEVTYSLISYLKDKRLQEVD